MCNTRACAEAGAVVAPPDRYAIYTQIRTRILIRACVEAGAVVAPPSARPTCRPPTAPTTATPPRGLSTVARASAAGGAQLMVRVKRRHALLVVSCTVRGKGSWAASNSPRRVLWAPPSVSRCCRQAPCATSGPCTVVRQRVRDDLFVTTCSCAACGWWRV